MISFMIKRLPTDDERKAFRDQLNRLVKNMRHRSVFQISASRKTTENYFICETLKQSNEASDGDHSNPHQPLFTSHFICKPLRIGNAFFEHLHVCDDLFLICQKPVKATGSALPSSHPPNHPRPRPHLPFRGNHAPVKKSRSHSHHAQSARQEYASHK